MNSQRSRLTWALVLAASAFISCGGGETSVGIDGTGHTEQIVAYGRLRGFGAVLILHVSARIPPIRSVVYPGLRRD